MPPISADRILLKDGKLKMVVLGKKGSFLRKTKAQSVYLHLYNDLIVLATRFAF